MEIFIKYLKSLVIVLISTMILTTSVAINFLNQANNELEGSFFNYFLLLLSFSLFFYLIFSKIREKYIEHDFFELHSFLKLSIISFISSIILLFFLLFLSSKLIDKIIYNDNIQNIANIYSTLNYNNSNLSEKHKFQNVYKFKQDLLDEIIILENKSIEVKDQNDIENIGLDPKINPKEYSFWKILSILILTDDKLLSKYSNSLAERQEMKAEKELEKLTDDLFERYKKVYEVAKDDFNKEQTKYNNQVKNYNSINLKIKEDFNYLNSLKNEMIQYKNDEIKEINRKAEKFANQFLNYEKDELIEILSNIKGYKINGGKCRESCQKHAIRKYDKYYGNKYNVPYTFWIFYYEKTGLTRTLEEGAKLIVSNGMSLIFQLNNDYINKKVIVGEIRTDDKYYYYLAKNFLKSYLIQEHSGLKFEGYNSKVFSDIKIQAENNNENIEKELKITISQDVFLAKDFLEKLSKNFSNKKYYVSVNDILNQKSFEARSKEYYSKIYKVGEKPSLEKIIKNQKYQDLLKQELNEFYVENMPINLSNKDLAYNYLRKKIKENIEIKDSQINYKEAYKKMVYPYIMLAFTSFVFLFSLTYIFVDFILSFTQYNKNIYKIIGTIFIFLIILVRINHYDLSESTDMLKAKEISKNLSERNFITHMTINTIMYSYPIFIKIENFKEKIYLDLFTETYSIGKEVHTKSNH